MGVLVAVMAAMAYGVCDFLGGSASRRVEPIRVLVTAFPISAVLITLVAPMVGGSISMQSIVFGSLSGAMQGLGIWWYYRAYTIAPLSVVTPLCTVLSLGIPALVGLAMGELVTGYGMVGFLVAAIGTILIGLERDRSRRVSWPAVLLMIGSSLALTLNVLFLYGVPEDDGLWPIVFARAGLLAVVLLIARAARASPLRSRERYLAWGVAVCDLLANVGMLYALQMNSLLVICVTQSVYPVTTIALSMILLGERLGRQQRAGVGLSVISVGLIAAG